MASQVLSGSDNVSYTNNTGQNVRIVIFYMRLVRTFEWAGFGNIISSPNTIGKTIDPGGSDGGSPNPSEIVLAPGQTFTATCNGPYNIVVIPEAG